MDVSPFVVGCDISKSKIDVFDAETGRSQTVANEAASLDRFFARYVGWDARFAYEATGYTKVHIREPTAHHPAPPPNPRQA